jgi:peptide-methionine (R)-S-oxide reductase
MTRIILISTLFFCFSLHACLQSNPKTVKENVKIEQDYFLNSKGDTVRYLQHSDAQWKSLLDPFAYYVLREKGTERAFSGQYDKHYEAGVYFCSACGLPLFSSDTKFDSGTGWPSFYAPIDKTHVREEIDQTYGMKVVEIICPRCGGHLGHVFEDGPKPTGMRYCMNSVAMGFQPKE